MINWRQFTITSLADSDQIVAVADYRDLNQALVADLNRQLEAELEIIYSDYGPIESLSCRLGTGADFDACYQLVLQLLTARGYNTSDCTVHFA